MQTQYNTEYRMVQVTGLTIFYREAGSPDAPTILFLHGFPSSSPGILRSTKRMGRLRSLS